MYQARVQQLVQGVVWGAGAALHPGRWGQEQKEAAEGWDWGGRPETQAGHHPEQEHCPVQQGDQASQVSHSEIIKWLDAQY